MEIALIGSGWAGQRHARAFAQAGARLRWAVDTDSERAERVAREHAGCSATQDHRPALDDAQVQAVSICLPHDLHARFAIEAAQAGKHVLVEKPLAATLHEADAMIEAAERAGVVLMVAENVRFSPVYLAVQRLIVDGAIGKPALVQMTREAYLKESFLKERRWFLDVKAAAGGIMMSGGVHDFETMRMVVGEIESVQALRAPQRFLEMEGDDTSVALVRFESGAVGTLVESFIMKSLVTAAGPEVHTLRVDGELGSVRVSRGGESVETVRLFSEREDYRGAGAMAGAAAEHIIQVEGGDSFLAEIEHFLECIRTGAEPITSGRSQRRPLEVVLAAYRSMEAGGRR